MFLSPELVRIARENCRTYAWAAEATQRIVAAAQPWATMSDDDLWSLMFGPTIPRSWMVWSNGHCPSCRQDVPMYNWKIDALQMPWKVTCPHCQEVFPKNDFHAFYRSGLDESGIFQPNRADRSLLFHSEHPASSDPQRGFGVDDGEGYVDGTRRWRFIGAYLIYGQWKQAIVSGIQRLAAAHVLTGDPVPAHKAGVLLDRVADLYPLFDFKEQGVLYEGPGAAGYVSTWHDACEETRELVMAYDLVREAILQDTSLAAFLQAKAQQYRVTVPKNSPGDICRNIETRILEDAITNRHKIRSNYPRTEIALAAVHLVLGGPEHERLAQEIIDAMIERSTAIDGVTGEKGLAGYSAFVIQGLAVFLAQMNRVRPGFLRQAIERHPRLKQTYRFHIDTWCDRKYYPRIGDTGWFAGTEERYAGVGFSPDFSLDPSMFRFFWDLYELTGDVAYVQVLYHANGDRVDGLPWDLFAGDAEAFQARVAEVIRNEGAVPSLGSVDLQEWHLAILRGGSEEHARAAWLDYDAGGGHGHADGMNLGLFAEGLDLMPDFGYPPVHFGGWGSPRAAWYTVTAAHNTVVVDGSNQTRRWDHPVAGRTTLWACGKGVRAIRASGPELIAPPVPERVYDIFGPGHDRVGLYFHAPGQASQIKVYTRAEPPPDGHQETWWRLEFIDDFRRDELGPDWKVLEGEWRIEGGRLTGHGVIVCTRPFPGHQRVEFLAESRGEIPCDLSAFLASADTGFRNGVLFAFGAFDNSCSRISAGGIEVCRTDARIRPGHTHAILCEAQNTGFRHSVDGRTIQEFSNTEDGVQLSRQRLLRGRQYERTVVMVDLSDEDFYLLDVFRVAGGHDHVKFMHSHFGTIQTRGLSLHPAPNPDPATPMRNFMTDSAPEPGWSVDWRVEDRYRLLPPGKEVRLRYTDLTWGAEVSTCEAWVVAGIFNSVDEAWIPRVRVQRRSSCEPLLSTFVGVLEPFRAEPNLTSVRRLTVETPDGQAYPDTYVAVEVTGTCGRSHLLLAADVENAMSLKPSLAEAGQMVQREWRVRTDAELCVIRRDASGAVESIALGRGQSVVVGDVSLRMAAPADFLELRLDGRSATVMSGDRGGIAELLVRGEAVSV